MFDREDKDLDSQVSKASASSDDEKEEAKEDGADAKAEGAAEVKKEDASSGAEITEATKPAETEAPATDASDK